MTKPHTDMTELDIGMANLQHAKVMHQLNQYFYENQYEYDYFRECDLTEEYDYDGNVYLHYSFYA